MKKRPECLQFGQTVRDIRKKKGLSQEDLADIIEIHRTYMGGIERGERNPTLTTILRIAQALQIKPGALLKEFK